MKPVSATGSTRTGPSSSRCTSSDRLRDVAGADRRHLLGRGRCSGARASRARPGRSSRRSAAPRRPGCSPAALGERLQVRILARLSPRRACASSTISFSDASLNCRVVAVADRAPLWTVTLTCRSNCTRLAVMVELAQRVADRSPPVKSTSTASALAMLMILSVMALTSSREYILECPNWPAFALTALTRLGAADSEGGQGYYVVTTASS